MPEVAACRLGLKALVVSLVGAAGACVLCRDRFVGLTAVVGCAGEFGRWRLSLER